MAFNQRIAFEVDKATGSDANGGGFDDTTGVPGTNYAWGGSQQVFAYTDLVIGGTTTQLTSAAQPFGASKVGNVINIVSGSGFTVGRYQVMSVSGVTATMDRAVGTGGSTAGVGNLGGALLTIQAAIDATWKAPAGVADSRIFVKYNATPYASTTALTNASTLTGNYRNRLLGYNTTHDDYPIGANRPTFAVGSGAGVNAIDYSLGTGWLVENIIFDGVATSGTRGVIGCNQTATWIKFYNCKFLNFSQEAHKGSSAHSLLFWCEVTLCGITGGSAGVLFNAGMGQLMYSWVHKCSKSGVSFGTVASSVAFGSVISNNSGASSDGITNVADNSIILHNTIYGNGRDGVRFSVNYALLSGTMVRMNIFGKNAGTAILVGSGSFAPPTTLWQVDANAFYGSGAKYSGLSAGLHDVDLGSSNNPFVSNDTDLAAETAPDWSLNNVVGAGALLRSAGFPNAMAGMTAPLSYDDIGAYRHADPAGMIMSRVKGGF